MFLLNNNQILGFQKDPNNDTLYIKQFSQEFLEHTYYYFRLGELYSRSRAEGPWNELSNKDRILTLEPGEYIRVKSFESFRLSSKIFAIFGASSKMIEFGLRLVHGPFVDPFYDNFLELGLQNHSTEQISLEFKQKLGKIVFFNIADTYPVRKKENSSLDKIMAHRDEILAFWGAKGFDGETVNEIIRIRLKNLTQQNIQKGILLNEQTV